MHLKRATGYRDADTDIARNGEAVARDRTAREGPDRDRAVHIQLIIGRRDTDADLPFDNQAVRRRGDIVVGAY